MMNQKVKNIIIISVVLIAGFSVFYFTKNKEKVIEVPINLENTTSNNSEDTPVLSVDKKTDPAVIENNKKFSAAMNNATSAFRSNNYDLAIKYYNEALSYQKDDSAYAGLYTIYLTQKNWQKALDSINQAIKITSVYGDYWKWKILVLDEGFHNSFADLQKVYNEGYSKVKTEEKMNLVTYFARLAETKGQKEESIKLWQKAIEINPELKNVYQAEIDRLNK